MVEVGVGICWSLELEVGSFPLRSGGRLTGGPDMSGQASSPYLKLFGSWRVLGA